MTVGQIKLTDGILLGPMAGVTDHAFRQLCVEFGAEYTFSEMISAKALCYEQKTRKGLLRTAPLAQTFDSDRPFGVQLFGSDPAFFAEAARRIESGDYLGFQGKIPDSLDINMGCPVAKVTSNGEGSALLKDPLLCGRIVESVKKATRLPVSAKIRIGWDRAHINAKEIGYILEQSGADFITVHGRTRDELYRPGVSRDVIGEVCSSVSVPVVANGDIWNASDAISMLRETGAAAVMIARGALGNPWIFRSVKKALRGESFVPPSPEEKISVALSHLRALIDLKGETVGTAEGRKHMAWYTKGFKNSAECRSRMMQAGTYEEMKDALEALLESNK